MKSSNGRVWSEFSTQPSRDQVIEVIGETTVNYLESRSDYEASRGVARILTDTLPSYYAIVSRIRHDAATLDENGGEIVSSINPLVKTCFPQGALTKSIRVGIQVHPMNEELVQKVLGDEAYVSPVVSVEPRHRKFHQPISITIPLPLAPSQGKSPTKRQTGSPTLRLLASIVGGMAPSQWEDVTGSSPMTVSNQTVTFTSTLSARFMLMECRNFNESARLANALYSQAIFVPFLTKFVVFGKRRTADEARLRAFVMTDDADMMKTLENQQNFVEVARSRDIEVFDDRPLYIDAVGNLVPHSVRSGGYPSNPLTLQFRALHENRLAFNVRVRDPNSDPTGQVIFVNEPLIGRGSGHHERVNPSCVLNVTLPDLVERVTPGKGGRLPANQRTPGLDLEGRRPALFKSKRGPGILTKAELHLEDIASELDDDWVRLAPELKFTERDIKMLEETNGTSAQKGSTMLHSWLEGYEEGRIGAVSDLEAALGRIGREDIVYTCIRDVSERDDIRDSTDVSEASDVRVNIKNGDLNDIQRNLDIIERDIIMFPESQAHNIHPKTLYGVKEYNQVQADIPVVSPDRATNEMTEDFDENSDVMAESIEDLKDDPADTKPSQTSYQNIPERDKKWSERDNRDEMRWGDVEMQEDVIRITAEAPDLSEYSSRSGENENLSYEDNEYGLRKGSFYDDMGGDINEGRGQEQEEEQEEIKKEETPDDFEMVSGEVAQEDEEEEEGRPPIFSEKSLQFSMDSELEKEASVDDAALDDVNVGSQLETQDTLRMQHYEEAADLLGDYIKEEKEVPVSQEREDGDQDSLLEASEVQRDASMPLPDGWVEYEKEKSESSSENEEEVLSQEGVPVAMMEPVDEDQYLNDDEDEMVTKEELERKEFQPDILESLENIGGEEDGSELGESFGQEYRNKPEEEFQEENVIEDYNQNEENGENYAADQVDYDNNTEDYPADQRYTEEVVSFPNDTPEQEGDDESAGSVSSRGSSVRVVRDISVGDPSISRNEYETEEVLEDGTVVTRRVVTTEQTQTITNRYVAYATEDQEEQAKEMLGSLQFDPADGGDVQTEEIEEVLDDGTVVKKTITRVLRREVVQGEVEYPEEQEG